LESAFMPPPDKRNVLHVGPPKNPGETELTPAMVEAVGQLIKDAGGTLTVWAVLHEDVYETSLGDGFYLHLHGAALNSADAQRLADLAGNSEWVKWHVRSYRIGLENDQPSFLALWRPEEEFTISKLVAILCEIPPGGAASKLLTGTGHRKDGPFISLPEK
jgi:hypothetical protein